MSDTSQGPGWWLASDGKWYPPEAASPPPPQQPAPSAAPAAGTHPGAATAGRGAATGTPARLRRPTAGHAASRDPPGYVPPGPPQSGMNGCLKAFLIGLGVLVRGRHHRGGHPRLRRGQRGAPRVERDRGRLEGRGGHVPPASPTPTSRASTTAPTAAARCATRASPSPREPPSGHRHLHRAPAELCADVTYHNRSSDTKAYSQVLWELQPPGGGTQAANLGTSGTLGTGTLATGRRHQGHGVLQRPGRLGPVRAHLAPLALTSTGASGCST